MKHHLLQQFHSTENQSSDKKKGRRKFQTLPGVPTPIVSPREISEQPMSQSCSATYATFDGSTIPSTGHPTTQDMYLSKLEIKVVVLSFHYTDSIFNAEGKTNVLLL